MSFQDDGFGGYVSLFVAGFLATEVWRWLGFAAGARLDITSAPFHWVRAVATALVAGLVTRMLLFPAGALADVGLGIRLGAFAGGIAVFFVLGRNLGLGVAAGAALLAGAQFLMS